MIEAIPGMCCDCIMCGPCCDYSENTGCNFKKEDGSCWIDFRTENEETK